MVPGRLVGWLSAQGRGLTLRGIHEPLFFLQNNTF
jgi:hypothetical protein